MDKSLEPNRKNKKERREKPLTPGTREWFYDMQERENES